MIGHPGKIGQGVNAGIFVRSLPAGRVGPCRRVIRGQVNAMGERPLDSPLAFLSSVVVTVLAERSCRSELIYFRKGGTAQIPATVDGRP